VEQILLVTEETQHRPAPMRDVVADRTAIAASAGTARKAAAYATVSTSPDAAERYAASRSKTERIAASPGA